MIHIIGEISAILMMLFLFIGYIIQSRLKQIFESGYITAIKRTGQHTTMFYNLYNEIQDLKMENYLLKKRLETTPSINITKDQIFQQNSY